MDCIHSTPGRAPYGARGLKSAGFEPVVYVLWSRPVWGAWIEMDTVVQREEEMKSRPVWGAWIEIWPQPSSEPPLPESRPVWGAWIEIPAVLSVYHRHGCRAPYGARGLKSQWTRGGTELPAVAPRMGRVD